MRESQGVLVGLLTTGKRRRWIAPCLVSVLLALGTAGPVGEAVPVSDGTVIGKVAAGMKPGNWAELKTENANVLNFGKGSPANILEYADSACWDPNSRQFLFMGGSHYATSRFVIYSAKTNAWRIVPHPFETGTQWHSYDLNAIDATGGDYYIGTRKYHIANGAWSSLPAPPVRFLRGHLAVEYFPDMGGLLFIGDGGVYLYRQSTREWRTLASGLAMGQGGLHPVAAYNPVHKIVLFGGWGGTKNMWKLDREGKVTPIKASPVRMDIWHVIFTVDPVSGQHLAFANGKKFYVYDVPTDTWKLEASGEALPIFRQTRKRTDVFATVTTPVSTYGIVMFAKDYYGQSSIYLYKHRAKQSQALPYPPSPVIEDVNFGFASRQRLARDISDASEPPSSRYLEGQIIVDPERPRWLRRYKRGPFFMCGPGDPEGFLYRGKLRPDGTRTGDQVALIRKLAGTGANCIYLMAIRSHGGDGDRAQNPFVDNDPVKGINARVLEQWEKWFTRMDKSGIVIFFFFYDDSCRLWNTGDRVGDEERNFIHALVNRFEHHRNLIWCIAEEYQEAYSARRVSNIASQIRAADDHNHVIAVHKLSGLDFSEFADDASIDQFAIQYNADSSSKLHVGVVSAWRKAAGRYNLNMAEAANHGKGAIARKNNWAVAMGGAYVMVLGMDIAGTTVGDLEDCGRLVRFMESTNFYEMAPHDELGLAGTEYVLARPGGSYIVYASKASEKIGVKGLPAGAYTFKWFDCVTGKTVLQNYVQLSAGDCIWERPEGFGSEVALCIIRELTD